MAGLGPLAIIGYDGCGYFDRAVEAARDAGVEHSATSLPSSAAFHAHLGGFDAELARVIGGHKTSPLVLELTHPGPALSGAALIGGCDDLLGRLGVALRKPEPIPSSLAPRGVARAFRRYQRDNHFVLWVLWRGAW